MRSSLIKNTNHHLMTYCLEHKGKWWANRLFKNKEVKTLFDEIKETKDLGKILILLEKEEIIKLD